MMSFYKCTHRCFSKGSDQRLPHVIPAMGVFRGLSRALRLCSAPAGSYLRATIASGWPTRQDSWEAAPGKPEVPVDLPRPHAFVRLRYHLPRPPVGAD